MFWKKERLIEKLREENRTLRTDYLELLSGSHQTQNDLEHTKALLATAHEQIKDLAYENDDLNRKVDLLESVLKQLHVPITLGTRKASERAR